MNLSSFSFVTPAFMSCDKAWVARECRRAQESCVFAGVPRGRSHDLVSDLIGLSLERVVGVTNLELRKRLGIRGQRVTKLIKGVRGILRNRVDARLRLGKSALTFPTCHGLRLRSK